MAHLESISERLVARGKEHDVRVAKSPFIENGDKRPCFRGLTKKKSKLTKFENRCLCCTSVHGFLPLMLCLRQFCLVNGPRIVRKGTDC